MPRIGKIAQLPEQVRSWLHKAIVERGFGDIEALTEQLNALCKEGGVAITVGKSAVGVESQRVKRAQEAVKATTEAARLLNESSPDEGDHRSAAAMALVQSEVFDLLLKFREAEGMSDLDRFGVMSEAALSLSRLSRSRVNQARWAREVEVQKKAAADAVAKIAKKGGMTASAISEIKARIMGINTGQATQAA